MVIWKRKVLSAIEYLGRCYDEPEVSEVPPTPEESVNPEEGVKDDPGGEETPPAEDSGDGSDKPYLGSKELNPDQKPLALYTEGMTPEEVDALIEEAGEEAFVKDAPDANKEEGKKGEDEEEDGDKGGEEDKDKSDDETPPEGEGGKELSAEDFLKSTGLTKEQFNQLPEAAQEKLVGMYEGSDSGSEEVQKLREEYDSYKSDTDIILKDPVIQARLKDMEEGTNYTAQDLPTVTKNELDKLDELLSDNNAKEAQAYINKIIHDRAKDAIARERSVAEQAAEQARLEDEVSGLFHKLQDIDPRFKLEEKNIRNITPGHKEWSKFENGVFSELKDYIKRRGWNLQNLSKMTDRELYSAFAADKGWDREREAKIHRAGMKDILKELRNPKKVARDLEPAKRSGPAGSEDTGVVADRQTILDSLVKGNGSSAEYDRALERADLNGNDDALAQLFEIYEEAQRTVASNNSGRRSAA